MKHKAVFLDRSGIFSQKSYYDLAADNTELDENVIEGLQRLQSFGYLLVLTCNELDSGDRTFTNGDVEKCKTGLWNLCAHFGIYMDGYYCCVHHADDACDCRKPLPGLLLKAADEMQIDLSKSWMVGHILNDVEAGNRAGCKSIMINDGNEKRWVSGAYRLPEYFARDLSEAARYVIAADNMRGDEKSERATAPQLETSI